MKRLKPSRDLILEKYIKLTDHFSMALLIYEPVYKRTSFSYYTCQFSGLLDLKQSINQCSSKYVVIFPRSIDFYLGLYYNK